ncbi:SCO2525 family SAM-dependent methyltransferase [Actinoplanes sp. NPDC051346]|uniref:SCO2525 family SAM-dependent methyltransferase n=1 Tax=Actinoplanes sp. NPDC051346 TaxID=3155048 RepID=UPI003449B700
MSEPVAPMTVADVESPRIGNGDVDWDQFDSRAYFDHNYGTLRDDDAQVIDIVANFFQDAAPAWAERAIDVGTGANLYPALTMLPFAAEVVLYERAFSNRQWLTDELRDPHRSWWRFWDHIAGGSRGHGAYAALREPFDLLSRRAEVVKGNVFSLPPGQFDLGTMFFVAESITTRDDEFERATQSFVNSLKARAPFAAVFIRNSSGYEVSGRSFPACSVDERHVRRALAPVAQGTRIRPVTSADHRDGYHAMIVATGRKRA